MAAAWRRRLRNCAVCASNNEGCKRNLSIIYNISRETNHIRDMLYNPSAPRADIARRCISTETNLARPKYVMAHRLHRAMADNISGAAMAKSRLCHVMNMSARLVTDAVMSATCICYRLGVRKSAFAYPTAALNKNIAANIIFFRESFYVFVARQAARARARLANNVGGILVPAGAS